MNTVRLLAARARQRARTPVFRLGAAAAMLAIALVAALLAQDVRSWRNTLADDAMRYTISPRAQEQWTAPTYLPASLSARVLGVAPDRHWLSALRFFALANAIDPRTVSVLRNETLLQTAEKSLARAAEDPDPALASRAYAMLGAILFKHAQGGFSPDLATTLASIAAMQNAVRVADGRNKQAEADLELLLRQFQADLSPSDQQQANNQGSRRGGKVVGRGKGIPPTNAAEGNY
jgi:hypothetical protein